MSIFNVRRLTDKVKRFHSKEGVKKVERIKKHKLKQRKNAVDKYKKAKKDKK